MKFSEYFEKHKGKKFYIYFDETYWDMDKPAFWITDIDELKQSDQQATVTDYRKSISGNHHVLLDTKE